MNGCFTARDRIELSALENSQDVEWAAYVGQVAAEIVESSCRVLENLCGVPAATFAPGAWYALEDARD